MGKEVYKVPLGYIQLTPVGPPKEEQYTVSLLQYTDEDLADPDNAAEAIMSAKPQPLSLKIQGERYPDRYAFAYSIIGNGKFISKHPDYHSMVRAVLALSPLDWMVVEG